MPDVWATVGQLDAATQQRLAEVLEARGADPQQQAMRRPVLADVASPARAPVLEVGCGTGAVAGARPLARGRRGAGVDPAPSLLERARELADGLANLSFQEADGRSLPLEDERFDVVVFDSTLSHIPDPARALAEAAGQLGEEAAVALKAEARRRVAAGTFFGHVAYASLTARKPSRAHRPTAAGPG